ncbi:non-canonical purine NTP pyrophosphatase [Phycisphaeraceae bacterium D3-23]
MPILIATSNPHKLDEIRAITAEHPGRSLTFVGLSDIGLAVPEPVEDRPTFEGNAELKAAYYAEQAGMACLADDSGLEVDALGGEPGVLSARYSGVEGGRDVVDPANNRKLMAALGETPAAQRVARFVCAMAFVDPADAGRSCVVRGTFEGRIITPDQADDPAQPWRGCGSNGFGYDPLFWLADAGCTSAQLAPVEKNKRSHRGDATRKMLAALKLA